MRLLIPAFVAVMIVLSGSYLIVNNTGQAQEKEQIAEKQAGKEKIFNAESFMLDNGMKVVVIPNHRAPVVTHMVWHKVGAADEATGKSGIAHFLEHLLFKGSENVPPGEFSRRVRALGGNDNAFTSQDYTAYYQSIATEHLETVMTMEADRMRGLAPPLEEVESERLVILEERRQRTENNPQNHFAEQMQYALFANHPYGTPVIGWLHEMETLDWNAAKTFYDRWYAPNNALLIVSGDITAKELRPLAEKIYGPVEKRDVPERQRTSVPPFPGKIRMVLNDPSIHQPSLNILFRVPSFNTDKETSLALQVLQEIMSGSATTRLYKSLVVDQKLATGASLSYRDTALNETQLWLSARPAENVSLETLEEAVLQELRALIRDGVTNDELAEAKTRMQDAAAFARDSLSGPAMIFGTNLITGATVEDIEYWPYQIEKVTAEQVQNAAARYINPDNMDKRPYVTGYLLPETPEGAQDE